MTFIAARKLGGTIVIASDTMISNPNGSRFDVIPGRLKIIILSPSVTIAFAGLRDQSMDVIRCAKHLLSVDQPLVEIEEVLRSATDTYKHYAGGMEFILVAHSDRASLKRVWDGKVSADLLMTAIGDRGLLPELLKKEAETPLHIVPMWFEDESRFTSAFLNLYDGAYVTGEVGGFAITARCSPSGHRYGHYTGVAAWDVIRGGESVSQQQLADRKAGMTEWAYSSQGSLLSGVGVVGCLVESAGIGYIYSPVRSDAPILWRFPLEIGRERQGLIQPSFQQAIEEEAEIVGGGVNLPSHPMKPRVPTQFELAVVSENAAMAMLPTSVELAEKGVMIACGTNASWRRCLADYHALSPDPVVILKIAIDRINTVVVNSLRNAGSFTPGISDSGEACPV